MKIKRILAFLAGILLAVSAVWLTNQPEQVSASVFQKTTVPKKFRGTSHLLIKTKGNRMWICTPHGQTSAAYVTNNRNICHYLAEYVF